MVCQGCSALVQASTSLDTPNWISPDGCRLYLSSVRDDASNIYIATKPKP